MLCEQVRREDETRCQETERDLKKTGNPTPHTLILDLCRTTVLHNGAVPAGSTPTPKTDSV